ncbi:unnamed protein product [Leptosia nina]|uniref:CRC domain-containing protein n=1 Tax=Leptosia nina TaxID=320188 RepID=A0AAV1K1V6_9NEOP
MDHNLDDSLNLDSSMQVDFERPEETVCQQSEIILDQEDIPMEFVYEEKQMLMDTGGEEIIISDFIGSQFNLQDLQSDHNVLGGLNQTSYNLTTQSDTMLDLQLNPQAITIAQDPHQQKIITLTTSPRKKAESSLPKPVAIAPKPPKLLPTAYGKPLNIAPKPAALVQNKTIGKQASGSNSKGNTVLAQIGKQILMLPANAQKIKLVTSQGSTPPVQKILRTDSNQVQIIPAKNVSSQGKPMKIITIPGQQNLTPEAKAVITKMMPANQATRFVTLKPKQSGPITVGNKQVIMLSPNEQGVNVAKKPEVISLKPVTKLLPKGSTKNKLLISSSNATQNVVLKNTTPTIQVKKEPVETTRTQIHQINVPGKGIQYIRLVTNPGSTSAKVIKAASAQKNITVATKADSKDDVKVPKLVRIAPMKAIAQPVRSSQSLLAPISSVAETKTVPLEEIVIEPCETDPEVNSKEALRALIENSMGDDAGVNHEVTMDFKKNAVSEDESTMDSIGAGSGIEIQEEQSQEHPLIVIPASFDHSIENESQNLKEECDSTNANDDSSSFTDQGIEAASLGLRPRKACNCTKSQCLKLYCDCFANGEFCNQCNCNNCYNNLQNEELRQKAIRGCLDRNPHAFKPKIGKSKIGGPELVRRHNKGCNCKRSGCLKNYCECYEARIACTAMCKCVGCRNVTDCMEQGRLERVPRATNSLQRTPGPGHAKQPCTFMTTDVIEAVCQCLVAAADCGERDALPVPDVEVDPVRDVIEEFARCLQDIIAAAHSRPLAPDECLT